MLDFEMGFMAGLLLGIIGGVIIGAIAKSELQKPKEGKTKVN